MKNLILTLAIVFSGMLGQAQKLVKNEIDEFTGKNELITSTKYIATSVTKGTLSIGAAKINNQVYLIVGFEQTNVFAIDKGDNILLKLDNGDVIKLYVPEYQISQRGGAPSSALSSNQGITNYIQIDLDTYNKLMNNMVEKIRVNTTEGYIDLKAKPNRVGVIPKALSLVGEPVI